MLQSHRSQVRVRDKVCDSLPFKQHLAEHGPVPFGRMHNPHTGLVHPTLNAGESLIEGQGMVIDARIGDNAYERAKDSPAKAHRGGPGQLSIPPCACRGVTRTEFILRVQKDIGIHENHRWSSPSICASSSWILSRLRPAFSPSLCDRV